MKIAVVGATGLVGSEILTVLAENSLVGHEIMLVASAKSVGKELVFNGRSIKVISVEDAIEARPAIAIFSAGSAVSIKYAPLFAEAGTTVIDNSSAWRMDEGKKLVVPEINASVLTKDDKIIANPNCSTIQMVMVLNPLHRKYGIKRVVVSTYQSVTGTGVKAVEQMMGERNELAHDKIYPHVIDMNLIPHIDVFLENGYTREEMKMVYETRKIMGDDSIMLTATTVRVPVMGGHSEAVNIEFEHEFDLEDVKAILSETEGVIVQDNPKENLYPMPIHARGKNEVFVGRIRRDESQAKTLNCWIVADNLRKGAATNAVQIAEYLVSKNLVD
jgi:aspartate-semialdehyde dehydrogenase